MMHARLCSFGPGQSSCVSDSQLPREITLKPAIRVVLFSFRSYNSLAVLLVLSLVRAFAAMSEASSDFLGNERFKIRRRLGSGGMGVVYEAHDRETDKVLALKTLTRAEASHISRFKNEFRSLADVSHPNLVALYEFMADGQFWFFTMELVQGVNFLEYVRPGYHARRSQSSRTATLRKTSEGADTELLSDYEAETRQLDSITESV